MVSHERKMEELQIFFTTVINRHSLLLKSIIKFSCPIWIAGPKYKCVYGVCERESQREESETEVD